MRSRAVRKAMRRLEAQKERAEDGPKAGRDDEEEDEEDEEEVSTTVLSNPFAMVCQYA
jgi:hypothetical protein